MGFEEGFEEGFEDGSGWRLCRGLVRDGAICYKIGILF